MPSYNRLEIIGNLGNDPTMKFSRGGKAVTTFSVATNNISYDLEGERKQTDTNWYTVVTWNKLAEQCNQFLDKGKTVFAEGRHNFTKWTDSDGKDHYKNELIASRVIFLDKAGVAATKDEDGEDNADDIFSKF